MIGLLSPMKDARTFRNMEDHLFLFPLMVETFKLEKCDSLGFLDTIPDITNRSMLGGGQTDAHLLLVVTVGQLPNLKQVWN